MKGNLFKRAIMLCIVLSAMISMSSYVSAATYTGGCGTNVTWTFNDSTGLLTISGTGAMSSSGYSKYAKQVKRLVIEEGVTSIHNGAFDSNPNNSSYISNAYHFTSITIPKSVHTIGRRAFHYSSTLSTIYGMEGVTTIGDEAFSDNSALTAINIPDSVTTIGKSAFYYCNSVTSLKIGSGLTNLGADAFKYCFGLKSVTVSESNTSFRASNDTLFNKDMTHLYFYCSGSTASSYTVPDSVVSIGSYSFRNISSLRSVTLGKNVTTIGQDAFAICKNLNTIYLSDKIQSIGNGAFTSTGINKVYIPSLTTWCNIDFDTYIANPLCYGGTLYINGTILSGRLTIPTEITQIKPYTFYGNKGITEVVIHPNVISIGSNSFAKASNLKTLTIQGSRLETISNAAFSECTALERVNVWSADSFYNIKFDYVNSKSNPLELGAGLYVDDVLVTEWTVPKDVTSVKNGVFTFYPHLKKVYIHKDVTYVGETAFRDCNITEYVVDSANTIYCAVDGILFNKSKTNIASYPKANTSSLYSIPDTVTSIGEYAFYGATRLTTLEIPKSVKYIRTSAFTNCTNLKTIFYKGSEADYNKISITNPATLSGAKKYFYISAGGTNITCVLSDDGTFTVSGTGPMMKGNGPSVYPWDGYRDKIKKLVIEEGVTSIPDSYAFYGCNYLTSVELPDTLTEIGYSTFNECIRLKSIRLGTKLKIIDDYAFTETGLTEIVIPRGVTSIGMGAFAFCSNLKTVTIPDTVTTIYSAAFRNCYSLENINVDSNNQYYCTVDGHLFDKSKKTFIVYCFGKKDESYSVPESVLTIESYAFSSSGALKTLHLPRNLSEIKSNAFQSCTSLTNIHYNNSESAWNSLTIGNNNAPLSKASMHYTIPVTGISLNKNFIELETGRSVQLISKILPSNATNKNVVWSSSNPTVATVTESGVIKAHSTGIATITIISEDSDLSSECTVRVVIPPVIKTLTAQDLSEFGVAKLAIDLAVDNLSQLTTIYVAVYDINDRLIDIVSITDGNLKTTLSSKGASYVKAFVWRDISMPSCPALKQSEILSW